MRLIRCGRPWWARKESKTVSFVYQNDEGREVEIAQFEYGVIILYPRGIRENGSAIEGGHEFQGLLSAQIRAAELLGAL